MSLFFKEFGDRECPTIVFLHGGGIANWMWDRQVEQLKSDFHCLVPDLPEHGESMDIRPFSIRYASELVRELIVNQAHDQHAHVVGLSLGAQVALDMMHICPEVMDKTIVSGTLVRPMKAYGKYIGPMVKLSTPFVNKRWFSKLQAKQLEIPTEYFSQYYESTKDYRSEALTNILRANNTFELPLSFDSYTRELLVLAGDKELKVIKESAGDILRAYSNSKGFLIKDANHGVNFTHPQELSKIIFAWLTETELPPGLIEIER